MCPGDTQNRCPKSAPFMRSVSDSFSTSNPFIAVLSTTGCRPFSYCTALRVITGFNYTATATPVTDAGLRSATASHPRSTNKPSSPAQASDLCSPPAATSFPFAAPVRAQPTAQPFQRRGSRSQTCIEPGPGKILATDIAFPRHPPCHSLRSCGSPKRPPRRLRRRPRRRRPPPRWPPKAAPPGRVRRASALSTATVNGAQSLRGSAARGFARPTASGPRCLAAGGRRRRRAARAARAPRALGHAARGRLSTRTTQLTSILMRRFLKIRATAAVALEAATEILRQTSGLIRFSSSTGLDSFYQIALFHRCCYSLEISFLLPFSQPSLTSVRARVCGRIDHYTALWSRSVRARLQLDIIFTTGLLFSTKQCHYKGRPLKPLPCTTVSIEYHSTTRAKCGIGSKDCSLHVAVVALDMSMVKLRQ